MSSSSPLSRQSSFPFFCWSLTALFLLMFCTRGQQALPVGMDTPEGKLYFAALLRNSDGQNALIPLSEDAPMYRLLTAPVEQQKKRRDLGLQQRLLAKKYDRNCFFSPVQCTLQQWGDGNPADEVLLGGGAGRRRRR